MYYPVETSVTRLAAIRRERLLPVPGQVLVQPGDRVGPTDVVARYEVPGKVHVLDVARALGLPQGRLEKAVRKSPGEAVQHEEVIAATMGPPGRVGREIRSPVDGSVLEVRDGLIMIQATSTTQELLAHVPGQVTKVMPRHGVVISAVGALIQGAWGSGGEATGLLKVVADDPHRPLGAESIDDGCQGTIMVGGRIPGRETLEQAMEAEVGGIIAGSIPADLCSFAEALPFPLVITEGFGGLPMTETAFAILHRNADQLAILSAETRTRGGARRPEVLIPLRAEDEVPPEEVGPRPLQVGDQVRVLRSPNLGAIGRVAELLAKPQIVGSGARVAVARVALGEDELDLVPLVNLERIR